MIRQISLSNLDTLDGGLFDRMKQEALEAAKGDESKASDSLTETVLKGFIEMSAGHGTAAGTSQTDKRVRSHQAVCPCDHELPPNVTPGFIFSEKKERAIDNSMIWQISLSNLDTLDGGLFDRMKQEALEAAKGDESKASDSLTETVLKGFIEMSAGHGTAAGTSQTDKRVRTHQAVCPHDHELPPNKKERAIDNSMIRQISLSNLDTFDGGLFDRMKQEALEAAKGDESKVSDSLTGSFLKGGLIEKSAGHGTASGTSQTDKRVRSHQAVCPYVHELPQNVRNLIIDRLNGTDIILVMEKKITATDLDENENCLQFANRNVRNNCFLTLEEMNKFNRKESLQVTVIQPCLEITSGVQLKKVPKNKNFSFGLSGIWNTNIAKNKKNCLQENSKVRLWSFRKMCELYFALVKA
ncbi:hypothetical protein Dsin_003949 [Dipteronia sinensis]|uniref:Uncharacterized protein n=1 Tax=Dipteronia sinensis TaxID=43782 RepID=A0AAE0B9Y7_9ROSI|nr:hypothetical protein Dsin_003949 [Dipteronia sinensis]